MPSLVRSAVHMLAHRRLALVMGICVIMLLLLPLVAHHYISKLDADRGGSFQFEPSHLVRGQLSSDPTEELGAAMTIKDLSSRIREMVRIRSSVSNELRSLEGRRQRLQAEVSSLTSRLDELRLSVSKKTSELERVQLSLDQLKYDQREANLQNQPFVVRPLPLLPNEPPGGGNGPRPAAASPRHSNRENAQQPFDWRACTMRDCFDYSRCSLTSNFNVYFYPVREPAAVANDQDADGEGDENSNFGREYGPDGGIVADDIDHHRQQQQQSKNAEERERARTIVRAALNANRHTSGNDPRTACLFLVALLPDDDESLGAHHPHRGNHSTQRRQRLRPAWRQLESYLNSLPFYGDGRNHIIINFSKLDILASGLTNPGKSIVVQSNFSVNTFRHNYDVVFNVASNWMSTSSSGTDEQHQSRLLLPAHSPARRKLLASYEPIAGHDDVDLKTSGRLKAALAILKEIESKSSATDLFLFKFELPPTTDADHLQQQRHRPQPQLSGTQLLLESTFALILPPANDDAISSPLINARLNAILGAGAIPVVLGGDYLRLPFAEVIDWGRAAVLLPLARVGELHFLLRAISDGDIFEMKRQGSHYLGRYLGGTGSNIVQASLDTALAIIRQKRLQIPAPPARDSPALPLYNSSTPMKYFDPSENVFDSTEPDENLGPLEAPFPSACYQRNYSLTFFNGYRLWNEIASNPFTTYPFTPFDPVLPSEAKFKGSAYGFRPIGHGAGGSGKEFSERLGGNQPKEQFTIVILTYEREAVLIDSLQRLKGLPYLNKILVVWNSHKSPSPELRWPDVDVPIVVLQTPANSLNNRFLPYDEIETEAILSMDDDAHLRHDEIIFGFRVWREARDRIVGFPGRYHAWDLEHGVWNYNSNYSCELSMVLTGAAFFHKYYTYLYSNEMPAQIRSIVDELTNCEDIAMNFLVSHITRRPPIKVTSRWTFRCPGCPVSLSEDDSHFQERHHCINLFTEIYGYNPLLNSQFRADSVLFKTRIPHHKQKCFKFL